MRSFPHRSRFAVTLLAGLTATLLSGGAAIAKGGVAVPVDEVRMLDFQQPVATVYVGNPAIADVTVIDAKRVFVLGKNYGTTNIVALDSKGNLVTNKQVTVMANSGSIVTVQRGAARSTYSCAGSHCEPAPAVGDDSAPFEATAGQMEKHQSMAKSASTEATQ